MTNNLRKVKKDLCSFAKRCQNFSYTDSTLVTFLITGAVSISSNLFSAQEEKSIENQKQAISTSIKDIHHQVQETRRENDKLLKKTNLELIQLMEQGDHVVKSPWSSWQYGINEFFNNWSGTYKGRGDKKAKYPYEGVYERGGLYERAVNPTSSKYSLLGKSSRVNSSLNSSRTGLDSDSYGLVGVRPLLEPTVGFNVSAAIRPKQVVKGAITIADKIPAPIAQPQAISFKAPDIQITPPDAPEVEAATPAVSLGLITAPNVTNPELPPTLSFEVARPTIVVPTLTAPNLQPFTAPGTGNGDGEWINPGGGVAPLHQQNIRGGTMVVEALGTSNHGFKLTTSGTDMTGESGNHASNPHGVQNLTWTSLGGGQYAAMKLVGGQTINIDNVDITFKGTGYNHLNWLFHTDAHNDYGESTWVLNNGTKVNINGTGLIMYTSQYHGSRDNVGFVNQGTITSNGSNNDIWHSIDDDGPGQAHRVMYFDNQGTITLNGTRDTFAYLDHESVADGGFTILNSKDLILAGTNQVGVGFSRDYLGSEIIFTKPMTITGSNNTGVYVNHKIDLDGGQTRVVGTRNVVTQIPGTTRESELNFDIAAGINNSGIFFDFSDTFNINKSNFRVFSSTGNNAGLYVKRGTVNIKQTGNNHISFVNPDTWNGGTNNIGYFVDGGELNLYDTIDVDAGKTGNTTKAGVTKATTGGTGNTGILSISGKANIESTGIVNVVSDDNAGVVASTSTGEVHQKGTVNVNAKAVGVAADNNGKVYLESGSNTNSSAIGASAMYAQTGGTVYGLSGATTTSKDGGINAYASGATTGGTIDFNGTSIVTDAKGLTFMADGQGKINFSGATTGDIKSYGSVFYLEPITIATSPSGPFRSYSMTEFTNLINNHFTNLNKLTLDMHKNSNLIVTSYIENNVSDLDLDPTLTSVWGNASNKPNIVNADGSDNWKTFLLNKSKLTVDKDSNMDDTSTGIDAAFRKIALSSSSITNKAKISGTQANLAVMAQEDASLDGSGATGTGWVNLKNDTTGEIALTGTGSVAMYASNGKITNDGKISVGDESVAIFGNNNSYTDSTGTTKYHGDTAIVNNKDIEVGTKSTGIYAKDYQTLGLENSATGKITIKGTKSSGMIYSPDVLTTATTFENKGIIEDTSTGANNTGMYAKVSKKDTASATQITYNAINSGKIKLIGNSASLSNPSIGMFTDMSVASTLTSSEPEIFLKNIGDGTGNGTIEVGNYGIGMYGFKLETSGSKNAITVGEHGIGMYSKGKDVTITDSTITVGKNTGIGVYLAGDGQTVTSTNTDYIIGEKSYGIIDLNTGTTGNTINNTSSSKKAVLGNEAMFIYAKDTNGSVTNTAEIVNEDTALGVTSTGKNYGIYSDGTKAVTNSGKITFTAGDGGNVGIYGTGATEITNSGNITLGKSQKTNRSIGIVASDSTTPVSPSVTKITNTGNITIGSTKIDGQYGIGLFAEGSTSTINNSGNITITGNDTIGAYAGKSNKTNSHANINLTGGKISMTGNSSTGYYLSGGNNSTISSGAQIEVTGNESNGVFANSSTGVLNYEGATKVKGNAAYGIIANDGAKINATGGSLIINGTSGISGNSSASTYNGSTSPATGRGAAAVVVKGTGSQIVGDKLDVTADISGENSVGLYSEGALSINSANISAYNNAVNFYTDGGNIIVGANGGTSTVVTGTGNSRGALLFYTPSGSIKLNGNMTATVQGSPDTEKRGTAFYYSGNGTLGNIGTYSTLNPTDVAGWARDRFGNGVTSTLGKLTLNMDPDSRLFLTEKVNMNLSNTSVSNLFSGLGSTEKPTINGTNYRTFMLYHSHLNVDQTVNLDSATDPYNLMEISNSSITNNSTMTGTKVGQIAMAQENDTTPKSVVTLTNNGTINLSGAGSAAIYGKNAIVKNSSTGTITLGDTSTGLYGLNNTEISNDGKITAGNKSTGIFYSDIYVNPATKAETVYNTTTGLSNNGTITLTGDEGVGITYEPGNVTGSVRFENTGTITSATDKNVGMYAKTARNNGAYETENKGTITLGNSASLNDPNVGMYTNATNAATNPLINSGTITVGKNAVGVYGFKETNSGNINAGDGAVAMYSKGGNVDLTGGTINVGKNEAVAVYTVGNGQKISNTGTSLNIGDTSFGFVNVGTGNTIESKVGNVNLNNDSVYVYSNDNAGVIRNSTNITSIGTSGNNYGIYAAGSIENSGNIDFNSGIGNVGVYTVNGGNAKNSGIISVGASDPANQVYSVGMAAGYIGDSKIAASTGTIENNGQINVNGKYSIGMYGVGNGTTVTNNNNIVLNADNTIGVYVEEGAKAVNNGIIRTGASGLSNVTGVVLGRNSTLENNNTINIDSASGAGVYLKGGTIINRGNIHVSGVGSNEVYEMNSDPTTKRMGDVTIDAPAGSPTAKIIVRGKGEVQPVLITTTAENPVTVSASSIGLYVDTSSKNYTKSIDNLGALTSEADLIFGVEAAQGTTSRYIKINDKKMLDPYNNAILYGGVSKWTVYSGSLTWVATPTLDQNTGEVTSVYMAKSSYTNWATDSKVTPTKVTDTYNFADGLEQRYGVEALGTRENQLFQKLNSIGNNEEILLYQAFDEMMGHQYGNTQLRINATGNLLDKEFKYLKHDWRNPSKQNNKIKAFGMRDEYKTDTAGIIDYTSNAYGVAYVHEDEKVKMGNSSGWYAGAVTNRFKFKDIGHSREDQTMVKLGIFKTMLPKKDYNGSLQWTIGGDVFAGVNNMKRKFLVVDDVFEAKSNYNSYGAALKTDLGYDIRMSERTHLRPYGGLKMEYGRFNNIKEDSGQMRLEVKGNDYFSVKPEAGLEFKYVQPLAVRTNLTVGLTAAYENELGKVGDVKNEGRVRYTTADWFGIRGEKEDRRGNGKFDLNIGVDNTRFGVTVNAGYDTKGSNIRGGIGFRAIY